MIGAGRWEEGSGLGTHVHPWRIHVNVWQNPYSIVKQNKVKINFFLNKIKLSKQQLSLFVLGGNIGGEKKRERICYAIEDNFSMNF